MDSKVYFGVFAILILSAVELRLAKSGDSGLTSNENKIITEYRTLAKLEYGDKCNYDLESKGKKPQKKVKPYLEKLVISELEAALEGDEFKLSSSLENARSEIFTEIQDFSEKIRNSSVSPDIVGICNDTQYLHCDKELGECRCGFPVEKKGYTLTSFDGICKYDFGSGCLQTEFSWLTSLSCVEGSTCVTAIENLNCTLDNSIMEALRHSFRYDKITEMKGYTCFCDKVV